MSALPILDIHGKSFRILTDNFNSVLSKVGNRPFVLISINGATETGKSFALSYFIRYLTSAESWPKEGDTPKFLEKFVAKRGRMRTTMGIDLWSEPFIIKVDGRDIAVLLMDCQGIFDDLTTGTQNAIIFSLSSLCSSISIFNLMRTIDESTLQQIQFFSSYAHLVSREKEQENNLENEQEDAFQRLIFLIRDFEFPGFEFGYHGDSRPAPGESNFFREVFHASGHMEMPPENVFVREEILRSYKDVGCFLMPHPGRQFTQNDKKPTDENFEQRMKEFVELVLSPRNLVTKRIGGQEITGNEFKRFVKEWGKLCKNAEDLFPAGQTIAESTAKIQNTLALNTASAHYEKAMRSFMCTHARGLPDSEFRKLHEQLYLEALKIFNGIDKIGGEKLAKEYRQSLIELTSKLCESSRELNAVPVSKAKTNDKLEKNKEKVSKVQGKLSNLEIQNRKDREQQKKFFKYFQMGKYSTAAAAGEKQRILEESVRRQQEAIQNQRRELALLARANSKGRAVQNSYSIPAAAHELTNKLLVAENTSPQMKVQELKKQHREAFEATVTAASLSATRQESDQTSTYDCKNVRVLFINNKFNAPRKLKEVEYTKKKRDGAEVDGEYVTNLFEKQLRMKLEVEENIESDEISGILKKFKRKCKDDENDGCIVIISTHGGDEPHSLLMDDLTQINLEKDVIQQFGRDKFPEFYEQPGKPKIFLFNACRDERTKIPRLSQFNDEDSSNVKYSDILIAHSTLPYDKSYRGKEGSCYLKFLHDVYLENDGKKIEIRTLLHKVGRKVAEIMESGNRVQVPEIKDRLFDKNFYL